MSKIRNINLPAQELVAIVREVVREELANRDNTALGRIVQKNGDGSYDLYIEPDQNTVIHNVFPLFKGVILQAGDYVYVYKFNNQLATSVILTKANVGFSLDVPSILGLGDGLAIVTTNTSTRSTYSNNSGSGTTVPTSTLTSVSQLDNDENFAKIQVVDTNTIKIDDGSEAWWTLLNTSNTQTIEDMGFLNSATTKIDNGVITIGNASITPLTEHQSLANYQTKITDDNKLSWTFIADKPTKVSDFTNDSNFTTLNLVKADSDIAQLVTNKDSYLTAHLTKTDIENMGISYTKLGDQPTLFSGSYADLTNKPTLLTLQAVKEDSDLATLISNKDSYLTAHLDKAGVEALGISYTSLSGKPSIPTKVSDLTNDSEFTTLALVKNDSDIATLISNKNNYLTSHQSLANYALKSEILSDAELDEVAALKETVNFLISNLSDAQASNLNASLANSTSLRAQKFTTTKIDGKYKFTRISELE